MTQIIYGDVLVAVNIYITYGLLRLTGIICHCEIKRLRLVLSAIAGGFFALIIIIPNISDLIISLCRIPMSFALIFIAFRFRTKKQFIKIICGFFLINFAFAGIMFAIYYFLAPKSMMYNNGIVYFNIDTLSIVVLTCVCYGIILIINTFLSSKIPSNIIYDLTIDCFGKTCSCKAFLDTGNTVTELFSNYPVIIVSNDILKKALPDDFLKNDYNGEFIPRYISCNSVSGWKMLPSFRPEKITVKGAEDKIETSNVYIAVTDTLIKGGDFGALLNSKLFDSINGGKYVGENKEQIFTHNS